MQLWPHCPLLCLWSRRGSFSQNFKLIGCGAGVRRKARANCIQTEIYFACEREWNDLNHTLAHTHAEDFCWCFLFTFPNTYWVNVECNCSYIKSRNCNCIFTVSFVYQFPFAYVYLSPPSVLRRCFVRAVVLSPSFSRSLFASLRLQLSTTRLSAFPNYVTHQIHFCLLFIATD